jgi:membrane protein DedA with SNARE-associated domain/rhodanese-related sulfurtransferase
MESLLAALTHHGYLILVTLVFLQAIGLPVPVALALLIAGGASAQASLCAPLVLGAAVTAMVAGDALMFLLGRHTGWWLLGLLCRVSLNPETCILSSADSFYKRGRTLLVIAKFIPGINTMAPPLAGAMGMRFVSFLRLDAAGAVLYICSYFAVGFVFSDALQVVTRGYETFARAAGVVIILLLAGYIAYQCWQWLRERMRRAVSFALPTDVAEHLASGARIYDVRSHGYFDAKADRIKGSRRLDPHALNQTEVELDKVQTLYVYCTCVREATSARVARELEKKGVQVTVLKGGLRAWKKAGLPVEAVPPEELAVLPVFV